MIFRKKSRAIKRIDALILQIKGGDHSQALSQECKDTLKSYLPPQSDIISNLSNLNIERHYLGASLGTGRAKTGKSDISEDFIRYLESAKSYIQSHGLYSPPLFSITSKQWQWLIGITLGAFTLGALAHKVWPEILSPLQFLWSLLASILL